MVASLAMLTNMLRIMESQPMRSILTGDSSRKDALMTLA